MPKKPGSHHVVPNTNGGWDVKKDNATRSSGHFDKKQDAVDAGRRSARTKAPSSTSTARTGRSRTRTATGTIHIRRRGNPVHMLSGSFCSV